MCRRIADSPWLRGAAGRARQPEVRGCLACCQLEIGATGLVVADTLAAEVDIVAVAVIVAAAAAAVAAAAADRRLDTLVVVVDVAAEHLQAMAAVEVGAVEVAVDVADDADDGGGGACERDLGASPSCSRPTRRRHYIGSTIEHTRLRHESRVA